MEAVQRVGVGGAAARDGGLHGARAAFPVARALGSLSRGPLGTLLLITRVPAAPHANELYNSAITCAPCPCSTRAALAALYLVASHAS
jgi:hypothetical protein